MSNYGDMTVWQLREERRKIDEEIAKRWVYHDFIEVVIDPSLPSGTAELISGPHRVHITGLKP